MAEQELASQNQEQQQKPQAKLTLTRDKHLIYFYNPKFPDVKIRYDLKEKRMEKYYEEENQWLPVKRQYHYFSGIDIGDISYDEEHFKNLIYIVRKINPTCISLSTFFSKLDEAFIYENYIRQGIKTECYIRKRTRLGSLKIERKILTKPIEFYKKEIINFFKKYDIEITKKLEDMFIKDCSFMEKIFRDIELCNLSENQVKRFIEYQIIHFENFMVLVKEYNYEPKALIGYLYNYLKPFENIEFSDGVSYLYDYYSMASKMGRNVKKYPKYLKSMHDIIVVNYQAFQQHYDEQLFQKIVVPEFEYEDEHYCVINPKSTKDLVVEGTQNNNCVGSYIEKIMNGQTYLAFMRTIKEKENSLVTLEIRKGIMVQYKGAYNRSPTEKEMEFIKKYCRIKNIQLNYTGD
jgi:hypothetical protein